MWKDVSVRMLQVIENPDYTDSDNKGNTHLTWGEVQPQEMLRLGKIGTSMMPLRAQVLSIFLFCGPQPVGHDPLPCKVAFHADSTA